MANETPSGTGASADLADISFEDALRELKPLSSRWNMVMSRSTMPSPPSSVARR